MVMRHPIQDPPLDPAHIDFCNGRMGVQQLFYLAGVKVLAPSDDHVLHPVRLRVQEGISFARRESFSGEQI